MSQPIAGMKMYSDWFGNVLAGAALLIVLLVAFDLVATLVKRGPDTKY